jgi:hypothetical protein
MPINVNGTLLTGNTSFYATDAANNTLFVQDSAGRTSSPLKSDGSLATPLFMVGYNAAAAAWSAPVSLGTWGKLAFAYTGGAGYRNVNSCYDLVNYRFTAPWTGYYLIKVHNYIYSGDGVNYNCYCHPVLYVNGSQTTRRPSTIYRIRQYGYLGSYGHDTDFCEILYLTAADYVEAWWYSGGATVMSTYDAHSNMSGVYLGS